MKKLFLVLILTGLFISCKESKTYNNHPVINASTVNTSFKIAENWYNGRWSIAPQVKHDTLKIQCLSNPEKFVFKTDMDSISFDVFEGKSYDFYVHLNDSIYAHTIIKGTSFSREEIKHNITSKNDSLFILYENNKENQYLTKLASKYPIQNLIDQKSNDTEKIVKILDWTNARWKHSGNNSPSKSDPITILDEAKAGGRFPCFAYAIVLKAQLENAGFKARTIYLKTKDVETRKSSPGHVATEVFINDIQKWAFVDGQFNVMPALNNIPLNAVEFQNALTNNYENLELTSLKEVSKRSYTEFVYDYLYYLDTSLDHRNLIGTDINQQKINDKTTLMLVPTEAHNPRKIDFWSSKINYCIYTNSLKDFYAKPH